MPGRKKNKIKRAEGELSGLQMTESGRFEETSHATSPPPPSHRDPNTVHGLHAVVGLVVVVGRKGAVGKYLKGGGKQGLVGKMV